MRLLVNAHPQPEVAAVDAHLLLGVHDVRATRSSRPGVASPFVPNSSYWPRTLLDRYAEDTGLHAGDLRADRARQSGERLRGVGLTFAQLVDERVEQHAEAVDVDAHPAGAVDDGDPIAGGRGGGGHPREVAHLSLRHHGELAQVGDRLMRLVAGHRRTGSDQPGRRRDREIPVDHLPGVARFGGAARHALTVCVCTRSRSATAACREHGRDLVERVLGR